MSSNSRMKRLLELMPPKDWIATFIALVALFTSAASLWASREQERMSGRPHLAVGEYFASSSPRLGLVIFNLGPGMAIADNFRLYLDGKALTGDWVTQWTTFRAATHTDTWTNIGGFQEAQPVGPNTAHESDILIIVDEQKHKQADSDWPALSKRLRDIVATRLGLSISYHSEYGEKFALVKSGVQPERYYRLNWRGNWVPVE